MKELSSHAAAAKQIRQYLKTIGVKGRVRSSSYSGGNSVRVVVNNMHPEEFQKIKDFANDYQYGHFDGMTDSYHASNVKNDLPQVRFVFVDNEFSDDMRQAAWEYACDTFGELSGASREYNDAGQVWLSWGCWGTDLVWRLLNGSEEGFWNSIREVA